MAKMITFQVPTKSGPTDKTGFVVWLHIADTKRKFVLQHDFERPSILTHYASGYRLTSLAGLALARYVANPYGVQYATVAQWRKLAQEMA